MYEKKKFQWEATRKCDRVKLFQDLSYSWNKDKFLTNCHKVHPIDSKEGRKLHLADFNKKFKHKPLHK